jgi:hypothetical protein
LRLFGVKWVTGGKEIFFEFSWFFNKWDMVVWWRAQRAG